MTLNVRWRSGVDHNVSIYESFPQTSVSIALRWYGFLKAVFDTFQTPKKMSELFNSIQVSGEVDRFVDHSFDVVNKIHSILEKQGKTQRDLAALLGKSESEVSKWMRGTHNFTLKSISKIEAVLGERILPFVKEYEMIVKKESMRV